MIPYELHYVLRGRQTVEEQWTIIAFCNTYSGLEEMIEKHKAIWKILSWNSYRAAPRLK